MTWVHIELNQLSSIIYRGWSKVCHSQLRGIAVQEDGEGTEISLSQLFLPLVHPVSLPPPPPPGQNVCCLMNYNSYARIVSLLCGYHLCASCMLLLLMDNDWSCVLCALKSTIECLSLVWGRRRMWAVVPEYFISKLTRNIPCVVVYIVGSVPPSRLPAEGVQRWCRRQLLIGQGPFVFID